MGEKLSEHFTVEEFIYSDTARAYNIPNIMNEGQKKEAQHLCEYLLEPLRKLLSEKYGKAIIKITSGFRGDKLNMKIKGAKNSQHSCTPGRGAAADIWVYKYVNDKKVQVPPSEVYGNIKAWVKAGKLTVDQCIEEKAQSEWTHVSCANQLSSNRKQFLKYNGKSYILDK